MATYMLRSRRQFGIAETGQQENARSGCVEGDSNDQKDCVHGITIPLRKLPPAQVA